MNDYAKQFMLLLMSEKCYDNYFVDLDFLDGKWHPIFRMIEEA